MISTCVYRLDVHQNSIKSKNWQERLSVMFDPHELLFVPTQKMYNDGFVFFALKVFRFKFIVQYMC